MRSIIATLRPKRTTSGPPDPAITSPSPGDIASADVGPYLLTGLAALAAASLLRWAGDDSFGRYFGPVPPEPVILATAGAGVVSLRVLARHGWPRTAETPGLGTGARRSVGAAFVFAAIVIPFDLTLRFPEGINAPWPQSVLFYPAIAFVAETVFHLVPLAVLVGLGDRRGRPIKRGRRRRWPVVAAIASIEAVFQVVAAISGSSAGLLVFLAFHLFAFGVVALVTFRRYGFVPMYALRLCYYALWHVAWGHARLGLLF